MTAKRSQPQIICFFLSLATTLCFLTLVGSAASDDQEKQTDQFFEINEITSRCHGTDLQGGMGYIIPNDFADVYLDNQPAQRFNRIPTGTHNLRVVAKPVQGQQGISVVEELRFFENDRDKPHVDSQTGTPQLWTPNVTDANVTFDLEAPTRVRITIERCYSAVTEKEVAVAAVSEDCKDFNWEDSKIEFGADRPVPLSELDKWPTFSLNKFGLAQTDAGLRPGTQYSVKFSHPHLTNTEDPLFSGARISKVEVYRAFPELTLAGIYPADEAGLARVTLDDSLWKNNSTPYIKVYVEKLCDFGYATIEFFEGKIEVTENDSTTPPQPKPAQAGMTLFRNDTIETGPGSRVQLKTRGGIYIIKIGEGTRVNIGAITTSTGRKFIEAEIKSGKIQIERVAIAQPPKPIPDAEALPEPMPVVINTPTLKVTDQKTNYTVSYDERTNTTTVGVEEGKVEVTPTNSSLQPFTLAANQQVQVTGSNVSAITAYSGTGGNAGRIILYIGIGVVGLVALAGLFYFFRRQHRLAMQPAFHPAGANPTGWNAPPVNVASPMVNQASQRCPNPQCGKDTLAGKKFCAHCGTRLNV
jgi:hypothetical protein